MKTASFQKLSNELLKDILDQIESDPERSVSIDRRAYLSVESFRPPSPPLPSRAQDIGNFRLVCRRFAELGIPHQFTRIATRFSIAGFQRLDRICSRNNLAKHTKKFSYLIPFFYVEGRQSYLVKSGSLDIDQCPGREYTEDISHDAGSSLQPLDASYLKKKAGEQKSIIRSGEDVRILKKAMAAFTSLQHVQILRLQNEADRYLLDCIQENGGSAMPLVDLRWMPACTHATRTIGEALFYARSPFSRFSGPMMNPQSALGIKDNVPQSVSALAQRLTCLELHFDDGLNLNEKMRELSSLFRTVFSAARNLNAVHIGFPSRFPLDLRLEDIFHHVHWEKLRAFGIQAWRLEADEIIALARRHSKTLKGLRLRDVQLKEGSMWKDVLAMLRAEMDQLDWVSLRRVDYAVHFDELWSDSIEVPDDPPGGASDSDDEDDFPTHISVQEDEGDSGEDASDEHSDAHTDYGPEADEIALSPDTPASLPFCTCFRNTAGSADDLGDNGQFVVYQQRKMWEKWVVGRCPEHSSS